MNYNLTLKKVNEIFKSENPTGYIERSENIGGLKPGFFAVVFYNGGKIYTYKSKTLLALCEKLDIVPETDVNVEAERIAAEFENGAEIVTGLRVAVDTVRWILGNSGFLPEKHTVTTQEIGLNEWNQSVAEFKIEESAWL